MGYLTDAGKFTDPEKMAADFLAAFFGNQKIEYPINPFAFLKAEGILFKLADFSKLEGVYIPASEEDDSFRGKSCAKRDAVPFGILC